MKKAKPTKAQPSEIRPRAEPLREPQDADHSDAELHAMKRQQHLVTRLLMSRDMGSAYGEVLAAAIEIMHADRGTLQVWDAEARKLELSAQRGFDPKTLLQIQADGMSDGSPLLRAVQTRTRVVVDDIAPDTVHEDNCDRARWPSCRAMQCTPLAKRERDVFGVVATYHDEPRRPSAHELRCLDLYARQAADFLDHLRQRESVSIASRRKDEFLAVLAHELRSPLAPISAGLELLRTTVNEPAIVHEVHQIMQRQLDQLTALIDDIFDISCITRGVFSMQSRRIDVNSVVESALEQIRPTIKAAGHALTVDLPEPPICFDGDPRRIVQVLSNLLENAIKFTPRGGAIRVTARAEGGQLAISVTDSGVGIAPGKLAKLFSSSGRGGGPSSGPGIGLTLVKSLVESHGGTIDAHSDGEGRGATFTVRLPAAIEDDASRAGTPDAAEPSGLRILVVDDNGPAADMLAMILESYGNELLTAYSGEKALELAETHRPDVILLDIGMPVIDGYETARRIRRQPRGHEPMLIALTGWGQERDKEKAREAGFDHHLVKPTKAEDLRVLLSGARRRSA